MPATPDIVQMSIDVKKRITDWVHLNIPIQSQFYQDGNWHFLDENQSWGFGANSTCLLATMYRHDTTISADQRIAYRNICIESVEAALKWNMPVPKLLSARYTYPATTPTYPGSVYIGIPNPKVPILMTPFDGGPWGNPDPLGSDENTTFEAIAWIAWVTDELYSAQGIGAETCKRWMKNLSYAANWLIYYNGNPTWYTNGNFVAHQALCYAHMAKIYRNLGDEVNWALYQQAYEFTMQQLIYPYGNGLHNSLSNSDTWEGYGYIMTVQGAESTPTVPAIRNPSGCLTDGNTETGHLSETPGYTGINPASNEDFYYETVTLGVLASLYTVNRDWRVNYLMNAIFNTLDAKIAWGTTYNVDCTGGSRKSFVKNAEDQFLAVICLIGRRQGNRSRLTSANVLGMWDVAAVGSLINFGSNAINQLPSSAGRLYRTAIATALKACYLSDKKIT